MKHYILQIYNCCDIFFSFRNDNQDCTNDSLLITEEMPDVEVEFTPDLTWKCKAKSKESDQ